MALFGCNTLLCLFQLMAPVQVTARPMLEPLLASTLVPSHITTKLTASPGTNLKRTNTLSSARPLQRLNHFGIKTSCRDLGRHWWFWWQIPVTWQRGSQSGFGTGKRMASWIARGDRLWMQECSNGFIIEFWRIWRMALRLSFGTFQESWMERRIVWRTWLWICKVPTSNEKGMILIVALQEILAHYFDRPRLRLESPSRNPLSLHWLGRYLGVSTIISREPEENRSMVSFWRLNGNGIQKDVLGGSMMVADDDVHHMGCLLQMEMRLDNNSVKI